MKRMKWKWVLPVAQLVLAFGCHLYEPHEYRVGRPGGASTEYFFQHSPALIGRISRGINFPALVLDYPLQDKTDAIYSNNTEFTLIWISLSDVGFFIGIVIFWHWVGGVFERRKQEGLRGTRSREMSIANLVCGNAFAVLTGIYAYQMSSSRWLPQRQIGIFGLLWAAVLLIYFVWGFARFRISTEASRGSGRTL